MPTPDFETLDHFGEFSLSKAVRLNYDRHSEKAWLELMNVGSIVPGGAEDEFVRVFIGACQSNGHAVAMHRGLRPTTYTSMDILPDVGAVPAKIHAFQAAIIERWRNFTSDDAAQFAKGTTVGKGRSSASYVVKALKTGFEAIGAPVPAYQGVKLSDWSLSELVAYAETRRVMFQGVGDKDAAALADLTSDFMTLPAHPKYHGQEETAVTAQQFPDREIKLIPSAKAAGHSGKFAYAAELSGIPFPRVVSYGFRGDTRPPIEFKSESGTSMQGFLPNYTRPNRQQQIDEYIAEDLVKTAAYQAAQADAKAALLKAWLADKRNEAVVKQRRAAASTKFMGASGKARSPDQLEAGAFDVADYLANEFLGGYVSLTRYAMIARSFACGMGGTVKAGGGWVYCIFAEGAFDIPRKGRHPWATKNEAELALPGMAEWDDVVGMRRVDQAGRFSGPVYLRRSLYLEDPPAFAQIYKILSGKKQ